MAKMKIIAFIVWWMAVVCLGQDPVLTPATLTDSVKNLANNNSEIVWSEINPGKAYKVDGVYDAGGLGPFFDMTRNFINLVFPDGIPTDLIKDVLDGNIKIDSTLAQKAFNAVGGYVVCILVGFLFIAIFPLVGCCFCICRTCGCCGGKMTHVRSSSTSCERIVLCVVLLVLIVVTGVGCICAFLTNERMTDAVERFEPTVSNNIDDVFTFLNNTYEQIDRVLGDDLTFVINVLKRDIDNSDVLVGIPLRDQILHVTNLSRIFNQLALIPKVVNQFDVVKTDSSSLNTEKSTYDTDIRDWSSKYDASKSSCSACTLPNGSELFPNNNQINVNAMQSDIDQMNNADVDGKLQNAMSELNKVPQTVKTNVDQQNFQDSIDNFKSEIDPLLADMEKKIKDISSAINTDQIKELVKEFTDMAKPYDKYRWYAGLGISSIILLVVVLQLLGLLFGFFGSSASTLPTKRGLLSTCGGNCLMASVGFIFIFSSFLMLLTTLTFALGSPLDRFLCQPLSDPELKDIKKLMEDFNIADPVSDFTGGATISDVTKDCADGKTVFTSFRLENLPGFNLSAILDYRKKLDLQSKMTSVAVDFSQVINALTDVEAQVNSIGSNVQNLDAGPMKIVLAQKPTPKDIDEFINELEAEINKNGSPNDLVLRLTELKDIKTGSYSKFIDAWKKLNASVDTFDKDITNLKAVISQLPNEVQKSYTYLQSNGDALVQSVLADFVNRIYKICDSLVKRVIDGLKEDIAPCSPIYNLFKSLIINGFCKHVFDSFNGTWFAIGWCIFFFIPSSIFSVHLAKHFRKMNSLGGIDAMKGGKGKDVEQGKPRIPSQKRNSVGHSDRV